MQRGGSEPVVESLEQPEHPEQPEQLEQPQYTFTLLGSCSVPVVESLPRLDHLSNRVHIHSIFLRCTV